MMGRTVVGERLKTPMFYSFLHLEVTQILLTSTIMGDFLDRLLDKP